MLSEVSAIVMCVERNNRPIAQLCIDRRVPFVDVSATSTVVASVAALDRTARRNGTASLISVGLAPGVSNLLARAVHDEQPDERAIDLTLLFGTAGDHGADSRRWILDGLAQIPGDRRPKLVEVHGAGRRRAHPFPFSDQHTLADTLDATVTTRICFESDRSRRRCSRSDGGRSSASDRRYEPCSNVRCAPSRSAAIGS